MRAASVSFKVTKKLRTTKVKFGRSISNQGDKTPDKVQVRKGENKQTEASKIRKRVREDMDEEDSCQPENNVGCKKFDGMKKLKGVRKYRQ